MSKRQLPEQPDLQQLKHQAKDFFRACAKGDSTACKELEEALPGLNKKLTLAKAQTALARQYGYPSWAALKTFVLAKLESRIDRSLVEQCLLAAQEGNLERLKSILGEYPNLIDERGGNGTRTALHLAAMRRHSAVVQFLLESLADPDVRCEGDLATPLHFAAEHGDLEIVRLLLEHGADPHGLGDEHGLDVIGWAACFRNTHLEVIQLLFQYGARHNIFSAVALGDTKAIRALVAAYADALDKPMAAYEQRMRPVHLAVCKKQKASLETLIDLGADLEANDLRGFTALDLAALNGAADLMDLLLKKGAKIGFSAAFALGDTGKMDEFLQKDPDALKPGGRWECLLEAVCEKGSEELVENLIRTGAKADAKYTSRAFGAKGYTPLHLAALNNNVGAIKALLRHGALLDVKDESYHGTPLNWAHYGNAKEAAALLESLKAPCSTKI